MRFPHTGAPRQCRAIHRLLSWAVFMPLVGATCAGGSLSGSFALIATNTAINLSTNGPLDWVHWGTYTEYASDRKAGVAPLIGNWTSVGSDAKGLVYVYQFAGSWNGYAWSDGAPATSVAYTDTGVWAYKDVNPNKPGDTVGSGFTFTVPADTTVRRLKIYVGAYNARGRMTASLSDASATAYSNTSLANVGNGQSAVYTLTYAANSAGQTLTITYTVAAYLGTDVPNVTLQAAALSYVVSNNLPVVWISQPGDSGTFPAGTNVSIGVTALDTDAGGGVTNVQFFAGTNLLGETASSPYSLVWSNIPAGWSQLTARATDNRGDSRVSQPVEIFGYGVGGALGFSSSPSPASVTLSATGQSDWAHWGLVNSNSFDHRAGITPQISNFSRVGPNDVQRIIDDTTAWSWTGGTPTATAVNSTTAVLIPGYTNGFELTVPADTNARTLQLFIGAEAARGKLRATLSDNSAPAITDVSLFNYYSPVRRTVAVAYVAGSSNQTLKVTYTSRATYDDTFGNVSLHSAMLSVNGAPVISGISDQLTVTDWSLPAIPFTVWDAETPASNLVVTASSSNTNVVADAQLAVSGTGSNRFLNVTWATNQTGNSLITVTVTDTAGRYNSSSFLLTILPPNITPVLAPIPDQVIDEQTTLILTNSATDANDPPQLLTFSLVAAPTNAVIDPVTGLFTWSPTEVQGPSTNTIAVAVTDDGLPPLSSTQTFVVVVREVNLPPSLAPISDRLAHKLYPLTFAAAASDPDWPRQSLSYSLGTNAPAGAAIDPVSGVFSWTPTLDQGPAASLITVIVTDSGTPPLSDSKAFTVFVVETNRAPVLSPIPDATVLEGQPLIVSNTVWDVDWPPQRLTFSLDTNAPAGAYIDPGTGVFAWTPSEQQGPGTNLITVQVTDDGLPPLTTTQSFTVTVLETNSPPVLQPVADVTVFEGQLLVITNSASDSDWPVQTLTFALNPDAPAGAGINPTNGIFTWTPAEQQGPGTNRITVTVTDNGSPPWSASQSFTVTVLESNRPPTLAAVPDLFVVRGQALAYTNLATDPDWPPQALAFSLDTNAPAGMHIDPTNGILTWTPTMEQGPGTNGVRVIVTDNGSPALSDTKSFTVFVLETNRAPILAAVANIAITEQQTLRLTNFASDVDWPAQTLTFSLRTNAPAGASINPASGVFTWTPTELQGPSSNAITVTVTDNGSPPLSGSQTFTVVVLESNLPPALAPITDVTVVEQHLLVITNTATDPDWPIQTLTFSLNTNAPAGAVINATNGVFTWTPAENQGPGTNLVTVTVTDNGSPALSASQSFTIVVLESNRPPVLAPITDVTVVEQQFLMITNTATDPDWPTQALTFSLNTNAPAGAAINATNGVFTWTPTELQGPSSNAITVTVTDNGSPPLSSSQTFTIVVLESNLPPALAPITDVTVVEQHLLMITNSATDPDWPTQTLTFSLNTNAPAGATINATNGVFTWTPAENQGPGTNLVTVTVTDNGSPALSAAQSFTIVVLESNRPPVLAPISDVTVVEQQLLIITNTATDPDWPAQALTFSLDTNAPAGASINPTNGLFTWTPAEDQGPGTNLITIVVTDNGQPALASRQTFTITVLESNLPPVIDAIAYGKILEGHMFSEYVRATDPDLPPQHLSFSLGAGAPTGAAIDSSTGIFTWTPAEQQGPGNYPITVVVTDDGAPPLSDSTSFYIQVVEENLPPVLAPIADATVTAGQLLSFTNTASDPDWPAQIITFSLGTNAPAGALVDPVSGLFTWTPAQSQAGTNTIQVIATDNGSPPLSAEQAFTVVVLRTNEPPVLAPIPDQVLHARTTLVLTNSASDPDAGQVLTFALGTNSPAGCEIDAASGVLTWTPPDDAVGTNAIVVLVADNGVPSLTDSKSFLVTVAPRPHQVITLSNDVVTITWSAIARKSYRVQKTPDLIAGVWTDLAPDVVAAEATASASEPIGGEARYYRIVVLP